MRACRVCGRLYPVDASYCPVDGQGLYEAASVSVHPEGHQDERVGTLLFGRYHIRRVVADGGMARVYEALDTEQNRHVAIKILHASMAQDEVSVARFRREFDVSRELSNLHLVEVIDCRETLDGSFALVMEFLYGEELRATLRREGGLAAERVIRLLSQAALALQGAHATRVVHRDLKPDNIFLCQTPNGDLLKILDFGSARDNAENAEKLTVMGTTIGSPYYMPPEQAQGLDSLDHRADVWAMGVIAYECLTGTVPFQGPNGPSILLEILTKDPVPPSLVERRINVDIPVGVDVAILGALAKSPDERFGSIAELATKLGLAMGLSGDYRDWATVSESRLRHEISNCLPQLMESTTALKLEQTVSDGFFAQTTAGVPGARETSPAQRGGQEEAVGEGTQTLSARALARFTLLVVFLCLAVLGYWYLQ